METCYIQIKDGKPINHPVLFSNLLAAIPNLNVVDSPDWMECQIVYPPDLGPYHKGLTVEYVLVDGKTDIYTNKYSFVEMTAEEKTAKQNATKAKSHWDSWIFNETTCEYEPPVAKPDESDGKVYIWNETDKKWESHL